MAEYMMQTIADAVPNSSLRVRPSKDTLVRWLALAKVQELRRAGLSYREIGLQFGPRCGKGQLTEAGAFAFQLPPEHLLSFASAHVGLSGAQGDAAVFLQALDALDQGLVFFTCEGMLLHANKAFSNALNACCEEKRLQAEIQHFASSLCELVRLREYGNEATVQGLAVREVPLHGQRYQLKGSFIGLDLFGRGSTTLIALENPSPEPLSDEALQERFGLSKKESRVLRLLVEGKTNEEIAYALFLSPHTVRNHAVNIFNKLSVTSRTAAAVRVLTR